MTDYPLLMFKAVLCDLVRGRMILKGWIFILWTGLRYVLMFHTLHIQSNAKYFHNYLKILGPKTRLKGKHFKHSFQFPSSTIHSSTLFLKSNIFLASSLFPVTAIYEITICEVVNTVMIVNSCSRE